MLKKIMCLIFGHLDINHQLMKQNITKEQLNELSGKGKERLREWGLKHLEVGNWWLEYADYWDKLQHIKPQSLWIRRLWDGDGSEEYSRDPRQNKLMWPLLSIGQMIEFLDEHYNEISLGFNDSGVYWHVHVGSRRTGNMMEGFGKTYDSNEDDEDLVDALWSACKEILEKK